MNTFYVVILGYCDGSSFSSRKLEAVPVTSGADEKGEGGVVHEGQFVHYKGHYILDAVYDMFLVRHDMAQASEVVISGSSAGGLAVLNHIDYLKHKIHTRSRTKPVVVGIVDGGYFMDVPSISGENMINQVYKNIFLQQNVTVNHKCMKFYEETQPGQGWKCMMPQYSMQFISTPIFHFSPIALLHFTFLRVCFIPTKNSISQSSIFSGQSNPAVVMISNSVQSATDKPVSGVLRERVLNTRNHSRTKSSKIFKIRFSASLAGSRPWYTLQIHDLMNLIEIDKTLN